MLQKNFERDPQNSIAAWEYFRELNRQGKFLTVIRLYKTDELQLLDKRNGEYREKIREQYFYAADTMKYLDKAMKTETQAGYRSST